MNESFIVTPPPARGARIRTWLRVYRVPLVITIVFAGLLLVLAAFSRSTGGRTVITRPAATIQPEPGSRSVCSACEGHCDQETGRCVRPSSEPLSCVQGARYDEREGFCIPAAPKPTAVPTRTLVPVNPLDGTPRPRTPFPFFATFAPPQTMRPTTAPEATQAP